MGLHYFFRAKTKKLKYITSHAKHKNISSFEFFFDFPLKNLIILIHLIQILVLGTEDFSYDMKVPSVQSNDQ